jgi:ribosome biogenesis GTPase
MNKTNNFHDGIVIKKNKGQCWVWTQGMSLRCDLNQSAYPAKNNDKKYRYHRHEDTADIVVGDRVSINLSADGSPQIWAVHQRVNQLTRRAAKPHPGAVSTGQVVAANVDQLVAVIALSHPAPSWNLLDRYLVSAEALEIDALICLTKMDVSGDEDGILDQDTQTEIETYQHLGYHVVLTSVRTGEGLAALKQSLNGKVSLLMGKSGVGKSSLLNALLPDLNLRVGEINTKTGKGRHTTTGAEMYACDSSGWLIDTAGTREFGLWNVESNQMAWFFPEMRPWLGLCRFGLDCQHDEEPDCAIRQAVMRGQISPRRYFSMMKLKEEGYTNER